MRKQHIRLTPAVVYGVFSEPSVERYAITYARVSTEGQIDGTSLDVQVRECRQAAEKMGVQVLQDFIEEGVSGTLLERPALADAIALCTKNKGKVAYFIIKDVDRLARDSLVYLSIKSQLKALGVQLYSINQPSINDLTPESRFLEGIFTNVAQLERDKIHQRTVGGQKEAREQGAWQHLPPYGYISARHSSGAATLAPDPIRAPIVVRCFEQYADGLDQQIICEKLQAQGVLTARRGSFSKQSMSHMLRNVVYVGKIQDPQDPKRLIEGLHPAIVSMSLWERVQDRLRHRSPFAKRSLANPHFPLVNILRCHLCDGPMAGSFSTGRAGTKYGYYDCRRKGCKAKSLPYEAIERDFERALQVLEPTDRCIKMFERDVVKVYREKWQASATERTKLQRQKTELEAKRHAIEDRYITGKITDETYERHVSAVQAELLHTSEALEGHALSEAKVGELLTFTRSFLSSISNTWKNSTVERRRIIQRLLFPIGIRCEADGRLRTLDLPPLLQLISGYRQNQSNVVDEIRASWNTLMADLRSWSSLSELRFPSVLYA